jgi:hypothetical protein
MQNQQNAQTIDQFYQFIDAAEVLGITPDNLKPVILSFIKSREPSFDDQALIGLLDYQNKTYSKEPVSDLTDTNLITFVEMYLDKGIKSAMGGMITHNLGNALEEAQLIDGVLSLNCIDITIH